VQEVQEIPESQSRGLSKAIVMSRNINAQSYYGGRSELRYLPLFNSVNATLNPPRQARSEKGLQCSDLLYSLM
jgi:hypothetical protein